jgi:hypothetical protein
MKSYALAVALMVAVAVNAQQQTGHVLSAETHRSHGTSSIYNQSSGTWSHGSTNSKDSDTEIQVGNLVYASPRIHKEIQVGKDYPVTIETDKHDNPKKLTLVVGEKSYTYGVAGTREVKPN